MQSKLSHKNAAHTALGPSHSKVAGRIAGSDEIIPKKKEKNEIQRVSREFGVRFPYWANAVDRAGKVDGGAVRTKRKKQKKNHSEAAAYGGIGINETQFCQSVFRRLAGKIRIEVRLIDLVCSALMLFILCALSNHLKSC